jgi:hypothetical protein
MTGLWARKEPHLSQFGQAMDALEVRVSTPNEQLFGEVRGWYEVRVAILAGYAERVGDQETARQLTQLARLLFAARQREYRALVEEHLSPPVVPLSGRAKEFRERQDATMVEGISADGAVSVTSVGLNSFHVSLVRGTADRIGSAGIAADATEAANQLVWAWLSSIDELKKQRREEGW